MNVANILFWWAVVGSNPRAISWMEAKLSGRTSTAMYCARARVLENRFLSCVGYSLSIISPYRRSIETPSSEEIIKLLKGMKFFRRTSLGLCLKFAAAWSSSLKNVILPIPKESSTCINIATYSPPCLALVNRQGSTPELNIPNWSNDAPHTLGTNGGSNRVNRIQDSRHLERFRQKDRAPLVAS